MKKSFIWLIYAVGLVLDESLFWSALKQHRPRTASESLSRLYMGKGSRKAKKSKSAKASGSPISGGKGVPVPRRVQAGTGVSVRKQIAYAKAYKRLVSGTGVSSTLSPTRKFKQPKTEKREQEEYVEIDYETTKPPAVFVDGYNVIGYLSKKNNKNNDNGMGNYALVGHPMGILDTSVSIEDARDSLVGDLGVLVGATGWMVEVVFDAYKAKRGTLVAQSGIQDT